MDKVLFCLGMLFSTLVFAVIPDISPFKKVVIVVFENTDEADAIQQPTFATLANRGAYFTNFHAVARPSQPNYIAMTSADTHGIDHNNPVSLSVASIVDLIDNHSLTWKAYAEDYPGNCDLVASSGRYVRKHNPFMSYANITENKVRCAQVVNAAEFSQDIELDTLPDFSFYIPNLVNNGHDLGVGAADEWLEKFLLPLMHHENVQKNDVLFVLTFDESNPKGDPDDVAENQIYTTFYGTMVNNVKLGEYYDFYNLIRTIEDAWELGTLDLNDKNAAPVNPIVWVEKE